jgi:Asp-tRNA(Asn)/Glu-tRNA(Gln) amidotransferase A subunit family amidase
MVTQKIADGTELIRQMQAGERTAVSIVSEYIARLDANHPRLNAAVHIFKDQALAAARNPQPGPLSGLPISIKETFGIAGQTVTAGSRRMPPIFHNEDSEIVRRLRAAGAIILARSNVPEFAMAGETDNLLYGRTNNPLDETRTCGGSSGGEGALVGSGSTVFGVGSDILGSLRIPGTFCGIVGMKAASGAIDKRGTWPDLTGMFLDSWLGLGPLTRSVRDARLVYNVIARRPLPAQMNPAGARLIIPHGFNYSWEADCIKAALVEAETVLALAGMEVEEQPFPDIDTHFLDLQKMLAHELVPPFYEMLRTAEGNAFTLAAELVRQVVGRPSIYAGLFQLMAVAPILKPRRPGAAEMARNRFLDARRALHALLGQDGVLLLPTIGVLAPPHGVMNRSSLRPGVNGTVTSLTFCNYMDLAAISIPAEKNSDPETGLIPGVMLAAAPGGEARLFDAAAALEGLV